MERLKIHSILIYSHLILYHENAPCFYLDLIFHEKKKVFYFIAKAFKISCFIEDGGCAPEKVGLLLKIKYGTPDIPC